jgi:hypothetical protein
MKKTITQLEKARNELQESLGKAMLEKCLDDEQRQLRDYIVRGIKSFIKDVRKYFYIII